MPPRRISCSTPKGVVRYFLFARWFSALLSSIIPFPRVNYLLLRQCKDMNMEQCDRLNSKLCAVLRFRVFYGHILSYSLMLIRGLIVFML